MPIVGLFISLFLPPALRWALACGAGLPTSHFSLKSKLQIAGSGESITGRHGAMNDECATVQPNVFTGRQSRQDTP